MNTIIEKSLKKVLNKKLKYLKPITSDNNVYKLIFSDKENRSYLIKNNSKIIALVAGNIYLENEQEVQKFDDELINKIKNEVL